MPCGRPEDRAVRLWKTSGDGSDWPPAAESPTANARGDYAIGSLELEEAPPRRAARAAENGRRPGVVRVELQRSTALKPP